MQRQRKNSVPFVGTVDVQSIHSIHSLGGPEEDELMELPDLGELREDRQIALLARELAKLPSMKLETSAAALKQVVTRMGGDKGVIEVEEVQRLISAIVNCNYMTWRRAG